jgi:hypothetical protein
MARNYVAAHVVMYDALHEVDVVDADDDGEPALSGHPARGGRVGDPRATTRSRATPKT